MLSLSMESRTVHQMEWVRNLHALIFKHMVAGPENAILTDSSQGRPTQ